MKKLGSSDCNRSFSLYFVIINSNVYITSFREAIKEDDDGLLEASVADIIQREKRKRLALRKGRPRLGMMRYIYLVIDASDAMSIQDLKPTRFLCTLKVSRDVFMFLIKLVRFFISFAFSVIRSVYRRTLRSESS